MSWLGSAVEFADKFEELVRDISNWSQDTFGIDEVRGPIGPLRHLQKEAREAELSPRDIVEYADCLILLLDASRRAGFKPTQLVEAAIVKMRVNRSRQWPKPEDATTPVMHLPEETER